VARAHHVNIHAFADDTQLYVHCRRVDTTSTIAHLEGCLVDVSLWMSANRLKLNPDKTELLWAGSRHSLSLLRNSSLSLQLGDETVAASDHLDADSTRTLIHAFVTSRVDYCNTVLAGASKSVTDRLQQVLNAAARLISDTRKYDRGLTHLLHRDLHWLDIPECI